MPTNVNAEEMQAPPAARSTTKTSAPSSPSGSSRTAVDAFFASPAAVYGAAAALRAAMLLYGLWQDANSPVKYTDVDYLVFTDAARSVWHGGGSPYARETYRYTPPLAWMLAPTVAFAPSVWWFSSGKVLFAIADLLAGLLLESILRGGEGRGAPASMNACDARKFAAVWLLNPMVATISTRGSSEGLLGVLVAALLWAVLRRRVVFAGLLLGFGVHFKIYPFIYAPAILWWMEPERMASSPPMGTAPTSAPIPEAQKGSVTLPPIDRHIRLTPAARLVRFATPARVKLTFVCLATFMGLNVLMFSLYGAPFLHHTFLHHVTRIDHRHNFSPYNTLLYLRSAFPSSPSALAPRIESVAFLPQLLLSTVLLPLVLAKRDLPTTMLAQTFAFVTFNKVCTSQYFLWYMVLLPLYLPRSSFLRSGRRGLAALLLWVVGQASWLQQAFAVEFLGRSTFVPGLWASSLTFFLVNCWILGVIVSDVGIVDKVVL